MRAVLLLLAFIVLATLNSAGYRFGASDQAFYAPAVIHRLHPELYPRDSRLIDAQAHLTLTDEAVAGIARATGASVPALFAALYACSLALLAGAAMLIGRAYYRGPWATLALLAALTMRHAIAKTGTNTLEGYFHPRQLAFALGAWALVLFLRGRYAGAALLVAAGGLVHPTTALWFGIWLAVAAVVLNRRMMVPLLGAGAGVLAVAAWALTAGPLAGRLARMDPEWLATLATKDYLFPLAWPPWVWLFNLAYPLLIVWLHQRRRAAGLASPRESAVAAGCLSLLLVFVAALPLNAAHVQLAVQLQPARVFWMLDFLATIYVVWALAEGPGPELRRAKLAAAVVAGLAVLRGTYVGIFEFPNRPVFTLGVPDTDWGRVMAWARQTPANTHWLADPMHAVRYGTSVRVAGERDVFVELVKDQAIGMYDRSVAMRTRDRAAELGDFTSLTPSRARELAAKFELDYLVTPERLDLPLAFSTGSLRVYRLR